jgi:phosphoglycerate transport regulatory protein PgtC
LRNTHILRLCGVCMMACLTVLAAVGNTPAEEVVVITSFPKELFEAFKGAFEARFPGTTVVVKSRPTSAIVAYVQETASRPDADIVWASATDAFAVLKEKGLLQNHRLPEEVANRIPKTIGPYPVHDPDGAYFGFALSGYGIMWNIPYLQAYGIKAPNDWADLVSPAYHNHLAMSAPSRSGTTHLMVEAILQAQGWEAGWDLLLQICGNATAITERSFGVPQGVNNGEYGIGLVIDFFALSAIASGYPVGFAYPAATPITPAGVGMVKGGPNPSAAARFIHLLLGEEGQRLLLEPQISRLPVIPSLYADAPAGFPNPFKMESTSGFNLQVSETRYALVNALFDQTITFRLAELKAAWGAIHKAETSARAARESGRATAEMDSLIARARVLAGSVPLDGTTASDATFNEDFRTESTRLQSRLETEWDAATKDNYREAARLATQAME